MRVCPRCRTRYADGTDFCELDGSLLTYYDGSIGIDVEFSAATSAESPSGRRDRDLDGPLPSLPGPATIPDGGTRATSASPPPDEPRSRSKRISRSRMAAENRIGESLGSYRLTAVLGTGGMGAVYRAVHVKLGRQVALKLLHPQYARRRDALARFFQEAQAVNRIRHKNIVDVTDLVELEDGTAFIIMELLEGMSLGEHLKRIGLLAAPTAVSVLIQICDALAAAHEKDIVHRDLKPDNIFLSHTDEGDLLVKLLDFGVAKLINPDSEIGHRTAAGSVVGTPAYMSPEQAAGLEIDHRSDIYSLGAIMYQLFTGQHLFGGKSFSELVNKHLSSEPIPPRQTPGGVDVDVDLEIIIMRCLCKSPEARFQSATDLRRSLVSYLNKLARELGHELESDSGIYRLTDISRPPSFTQPPSTLSGPMPAPVIETALAAGDLTPGFQTSARSGSKLPLFVAVAIALVATLVAIGVVSESGRGDGKTVRNSALPPDARVETGPEVTPMATPDAGVQVTIRIKSSPRAQVFARGNPIPKCDETPCELTIDPRDGGSPKRRSFVLRADGHRDAMIEVSLTDPEKSYQARLDPLPATSDAGAEVVKKGGGSGKKGGGSGHSTKKGGGSGTAASKNNGGSQAGSGKKGGGSGPVGTGVTLDPFKKKKSK